MNKNNLENKLLFTEYLFTLEKKIHVDNEFTFFFLHSVRTMGLIHVGISWHIRGRNQPWIYATDSLKNPCWICL